MTTTTEQDELRALDAWIAEHVMGWKWFCALGNAFLIPLHAQPRFKDFHVHWTEGTTEHYWVDRQEKTRPCKKTFDIECYYTDYQHLALPRFTTDPAAAMAVLEKCADRRMVNVHHSPTGWYVETACGRVRNGRGETLPLAIARFAKALFGKDQK